MPEEEKIEVEETETTEEKAVEEAKVEAKTDEKAKAGDALVETKFTDGGSGSDSGASEEAVEMLKAALPKELPLGTVLKMNYSLYYPNQPGTPSENDQQHVIGLPDGNVGLYIPAGAGPSPDAAVRVMSYDDFIEFMATLEEDESLESVCCGCSMPSKDSTQFVANLTVVDESDK